ncbi:alkaline phosphatase [Pseudidiomarina aestuarii]|uniref:Alkaline phosphatase n=2 Tax=Pseudidiomarina aestuarii TaxID=624146 RepID=A0A6N4DI74_9GAMM|nr:alkaline phosphatase [Pseudidiomarina aestuarii]
MRQRKQRRDKIARLISWGHWFTFFNILVALVVGLFYVEAAETPGSALGVIYLLISWLGHFAFLPFVFFIILIFPFCMLIPYPRILRGIASLLASIGLLALIADMLFYRQYGFHLNTYSLSQLALDAETAFAGASFLILLGMLLTFVVVLVFELGLANLAYKRLERLQTKHWGISVSAVFVLCFLTSHTIHIWADAVFYTPITKQDDLFPLSYPTTAKTLMNKHGLLDDQQAVTTDRLLREIDTLELTYPSAALLCAKQANVVDTLIVTMDVLDTNSVEQITGLQAMTWPVLGQLDATSGAFELRYGLPDLYMAAMAKAQQEPAYIDRLQDYDIRIVSSLPTAVEEDSNTIWWAQLERVSATDMRAVETAIESGMRVFVLGLTNQKAPAQGFSEDSMQVPLYVANVELQAQQLTQLVDIMPTVVGHYMNCAEGTKTWSLGQDIAKHDTEWPMIASYGSQLVIYTEAERIVIDQDATTRMFQGTEEMPNAVPPTPILINALRDVKRFSATGE